MPDRAQIYLINERNEPVVVSGKIYEYQNTSQRSLELLLIKYSDLLHFTREGWSVTDIKWILSDGKEFCSIKRKMYFIVSEVEGWLR